MSVLLTVNIVSHNQARSSSDNIPPLPPDKHHSLDVVYRMVGEGIVIVHHHHNHHQ